MATKMMKGWEVEWCQGVPKDPETGDNDLDAADMRYRDFPLDKKEEAMAFAKEKLEIDYFGSVRINEFELVPLYPGLTREYVGKEEFVE